MPLPLDFAVRRLGALRLPAFGAPDLGADRNRAAVGIEIPQRLRARDTPASFKPTWIASSGSSIERLSSPVSSLFTRVSVTSINFADMSLSLRVFTCSSLLLPNTIAIRLNQI